MIATTATQLAKTFGSAVQGVDARTIMVEVSVGQGTKHAAHLALMAKNQRVDP